MFRESPGRRHERRAVALRDQEFVLEGEAQPTAAEGVEAVDMGIAAGEAADSASQHVLHPAAEDDLGGVDRSDGALTPRPIKFKKSRAAPERASRREQDSSGRRRWRAKEEWRNAKEAVELLNARSQRV